MLGNWIKQSTTTTGTGNLTLSSVTGYPTVNSQFAQTELANYTILDSNNLPIEMGRGYLNSTGDWVRAYVTATYVSSVYVESNATAADLPAGTKYLIVSLNSNTCLTSKPALYNSGLKVYAETALFSGSGTLTLVADRAYVVPMNAAVDSEIDAVVFRVSTAGAAGKLARCAVYAYDSNGLPGAQLALGSTVAIDSTGNKLSTFTRFRPPPNFFVALVCEATPNIVGYAGGILGSMAMGSDASLSLTSFIHHNSATGLTFPTTWTPVVNASNAIRPTLMVRCV